MEQFSNNTSSSILFGYRLLNNELTLYTNFFNTDEIYFPFCLFRCKERHFVNKMTGKIKYFEENTIFVQACDKVITVFAVYDQGQQYGPNKSLWAKL